ncbi:MAG: hypothetical protein IPN76_34930, partial [Saprospiraceae bacterium]|nr:hypothetical protein [Saprospiraceae bacterium]
MIPEVRYFLPNAFTPDGNGSNDGFRGSGLLEGATDFNFRIWNRAMANCLRPTTPSGGMEWA